MRSKAGKQTKVSADTGAPEVMWMVPRDQWGEFERRAVVAPLDLDREVAHFGRSRRAEGAERHQPED